VNIHIPVANKLDVVSVRAMHSWLAIAFKNVARLQDAFGGRYDLPPTGTSYPEDEFDLNSPQGISAFLLKKGMNLLIEYELGVVSRMIGKLTEQEIGEHTMILCLAAIVRSEAGRFSECFHSSIRNTVKTPVKVKIVEINLRVTQNINT
jgi:hypothetical protein